MLSAIRESVGVEAEPQNLPVYMKAWPAGALFGWTGEWIRRGMQETPEQMRALRNTQTGQAESSRP